MKGGACFFAYKVRKNIGKHTFTKAGLCDIFIFNKE
jgi:hypothetical protein